MRALTVATDSMFICFEVEGLETNIWKATVRSEPPPLECPESPVISAQPSPDITNPDGRIGMLEESSPLTATLRAGMSTGAYTNKDPKGSV